MKLVTVVSVIAAVASVAFAIATDRMSGMAKIDNIAHAATYATELSEKTAADLSSYKIIQAREMGGINISLNQLTETSNKILNYLMR